MKQTLASLITVTLLAGCSGTQSAPPASRASTQCQVRYSGTMVNYCPSGSTPPPNDGGDYTAMSWDAGFYNGMFPNPSMYLNQPDWQQIDVKTHLLVGIIPRNQSCNGSMQPNTGLTGNTHNDQISNVMQISMTLPGGAIQMIGWEYQTYGGAEFFQSSGSFSVSAGGNVGWVAIGLGYGAGTAPVVPWSSSAYTIVGEIAKALGVAQKAMPFPFSAITPTTTFTRLNCYSGH